MSIPTTGPVSLEEISSEFGGTPPHSLSEYYRNNVNVTNTPANGSVPASGTISLRSFYGAKGRVSVSIVISADTANFDLFDACSSVYLPGLTDVTLTVNAGVYVYSNNSYLDALTISNSFLPTDTVSIINNGTIIGAGGKGGRGGDYTQILASTPGASGGTALNIATPTKITNNGTIAGGGGGGGGGGGSYFGRDKGQDDSIGGGGGGGGAGFNPGGGGAGGVGRGQENNYTGRPGSPGTLTAGGAGGATGGGGTPDPVGFGGNGGALGAVGRAGVNGQRGNNGSAGGSAGYYLKGSTYVTWLATGTRTGAVS